MGHCTKCLSIVHNKEIGVDEFGKAKHFRFFSIERPYMRSFHSSWFCFFVAFTAWFGIQPLLPTIREELKLSKTDLADSGMANVAATIAVRIIIGPLCDRFGPRKAMSGLLICGSIPIAFSGLIKNSTGLIIVRLFMGILGGTFVPCQFWTTAMFSSKIIGTANAIVGGWGNLGGGFTFILMPGLFQLMQICGADKFLAWKLAVIVPSIICILTGISILFTADDCPQGHWDNRILPLSKKSENKYSSGQNGVTNQGFEKDPTLPLSTVSVNVELNKDVAAIQSKDCYDVPRDNRSTKLFTKEKAWFYITVTILTIQYGMCFGVEIAVNTVMNLYLLYRFKEDGCVERVEENIFLNSSNITETIVSKVNECSILDQDTASLIASLFGLMNIFARAMGGIYSDLLRKHLSIAGRLTAHFSCLVGEGLMLILFSKMSTIPSAIAVMIAFSICVQMSEGTTYAIVPYVSPRRVGVVAGIVGAGGNAGALIWTTIWRQLVETNPVQWFWILGIIVLSGTLLTFLAVVQEERMWYALSRCKTKKQNNNLK